MTTIFQHGPRLLCILLEVELAKVESREIIFGQTIVQLRTDAGRYILPNVPL